MAFKGVSPTPPYFFRTPHLPKIYSAYAPGNDYMYNDFDPDYQWV